MFSFFVLQSFSICPLLFLNFFHSVCSFEFFFLAIFQCSWLCMFLIVTQIQHGWLEPPLVASVPPTTPARVHGNQFKGKKKIQKKKHARRVRTPRAHSGLPPAPSLPHGDATVLVPALTARKVSVEKRTNKGQPGRLGHLVPGRQQRRIGHTAAQWSATRRLANRSPSRGSSDQTQVFPPQNVAPAPCGALLLRMEMFKSTGATAVVLVHVSNTTTFLHFLV